MCGRTSCIFASWLFAVLPLSAKSYRVEGLVLAVDPIRRMITVSHRPIPGYMPAMAMPFRVEEGTSIEGLHPGSRIKFQLRGTVVRRIEIVASGSPVPAPPEKLRVGAEVPNFTLVDEAGRSRSLSDFRGKVVAVDFIYTRCPLPDVCPRLSANFAFLERKFGDNLVLLSVTIDPRYDRPDVLSSYAKLWHADPSRWHFLTGSEDGIAIVAGYFGLVYWPEEGVITHTAATGIIGPDGRLAALVEGSSFRAQQLADLIAIEFKP